MWETALGLLIALFGAVLVDRLRLPAGAMVGALIGVLLADIMGLYIPEASEAVSTALSITVGITLAMRFNRHLIGELKALLIPALYVSTAMVALGYVMGIILSTTTGWSHETAAFAAYPAGLEQMVLLSGSLGGDVYTVTILQLIRWITVVTGYPFVFRKNKLTRELASARITRASEPQERHFVPAFESRIKEWKIQDMVCVILGVVGGIGGDSLNIPAGSLWGSFVTVAAFRGIFSSRGIALPSLATKLLLGTVGVVMGSSVDTSLLANSVGLLLCGIIFTLVLAITCIGLAYPLRRLTGWYMSYCVMAMAPAGMLEMTLLAEQLGLDPMPIFTLHFARTIGVITFAPILYAISFG